MSNGSSSSVTEYFELLPNFAAQTDPAGKASANQAVSDSSERQLSFYRVEVRNSGSLVAEHTITATGALEAISLIENEYGEPLQAEIAKVDTGDGRHRQVLISKNWHGYTFDARVVER
jgi:hypothetical protein